MNAALAEQFLLRANSPAQWQGSARTLKACADLVFNAQWAAADALISGETGDHARGHLMIGGVFFMLAGLAIENLVKGLLVKHVMAETTSTALHPAIRNHGIKLRLNNLKIALSPEEDRLVTRLEIAVLLGVGRYPVPLDAERMLGTGVTTRVTDGDEFGAFYERLDNLLSETSS